ncbi:adenylyltransferase and sulfurtransferase Uba4p [Trichomonascus vanleenenianus]|uniref:Uba4p n=1 Tax=Trichomonascus vanleenenianus TaxID=2268995 RepID=UPI003ECACBCD
MSGEQEEIERLREENRRLKEELEKTREEERLSLEEYQRYGRQLIMPEVGLEGQLRLKKSSVLVVGAGGLGCPALAYLAGAGIGRLGIVDNDTVDSSNLHRQILHNTSKVGMLKTESARDFIEKLNSNVRVELYSERLLPSNSFDIFSKYDLVLDCTDTPATRYLINDTAILLGKAVVSASALKTEGQLFIEGLHNGPCYRCLYPIPPPADSILSCGDGGIIGPVVGIMGVFQSIEAIKIITGWYDSHPFTPGLTMLSAFGSPQWRSIRMRGKKPSCAVCGDAPSITRAGIESGAIDYAEFCGRPSLLRIPRESRKTVHDYSKVLDDNVSHTLVDVRPPAQFSICALPNSINIPLTQLKYARNDQPQLAALPEPVYVCCRYGNDSQPAVQFLKDRYGLTEVYDIIGGLDQWSEHIDPQFPRY